MTTTVTQINYDDINQTIFGEMFNASLPYIDAEPPNMVWEEFGLTTASSNTDKLARLYVHFETGVPTIYKVDIDGYIVMYGSGRREGGGAGMFCINVDMMRPDEGGSNAWSYSKAFTDAIDVFYKSISGGIAETCVWVIDGSNMHTAYVGSINANDDGDIQNLSIVDDITITDFHGYTLRKLVIVRNT